MIHHVTRQVPPERIGACVDFYEQLGFRRVPVPEGIAGRALWLESAGTHIHLQPTDGAEPERGHVGVVLESYDATVRALLAAGHLVKPRRAHWGSPRAYVRDPAGNLVEVMAWPPPSS